MKKLSVSFGLIIAFAFYVMLNNSKVGAATFLNNASPTVSSQTVDTNSTTAATPVVKSANPVTKAPTLAPVSVPVKAVKSAPVPVSVSTPIPAKPVVSAGQYIDGTYTGPVADAYYGNIQVKATVSGGKLTNVTFLQYPNDRQTSIRINNQAMPILKSEAITAQSSKVDIVSGATQTSQAFSLSLASALAQAVN